VSSQVSLTPGSIHVALNQDFTIETGSPVKGARTKQIEFNPRYLEWLGQESVTNGDSEHGSNWEVLHFRCLEQGETELLLAYQGPTGSESRDIQRFRILIR
jgi:hypothetical protein